MDRQAAWGRCFVMIFSLDFAPCSRAECTPNLAVPVGAIAG